MQDQFDAIVIGSGMSGGWAAKELCEKGLKTLVLERGNDVQAGVDYVGENKAPWDMEFRDNVHPEVIKDNPVQSLCYAFRESTRNFFADDKLNPYSQEKGKPFAWIRGDQVGGRSLLWARHCYRWSDLDFEANKRDGHGIDWPIRYADIAPWYDHVERFVGISGSSENIPQLPDGIFQPPMELNCVEKEAKAKIEARFDDRKLIIGRVAHLTQPTEEQQALGRGNCQYRNQCQRGCSYGAYFSSVSATLPAARNSGNMTLISDTHVDSLIYDPASGRATGVRVINRKTNVRTEYHGKLIFLCASTLGTLQIMLNSTSEAMPNGFANRSGVLGQYIMDHHSGVGARGNHPGFKDRYFSGRRPTGIYVPRFRNVGNDKQNDFLRGYGFQGGADRPSWQSTGNGKGFGAEFKASLREPGGWNFHLGAFGEMLPEARNRVTLHKTKTDKWGVPQIHIDVALSDDAMRMRKDMAKTAVEMLKAADLVDVEPFDNGPYPGLGIHEMGGARMGRDPETSVLNAYNQCHDVANVFVTDGAAMASSACQNPSITYMALTARAVDYAVQQLKAGKI